MKLIVSLLLLLAASSADAVNPWVDTRHPHKDVTVLFLYEACSAVGETSRGKIPFFDCESYVYGVLDAYVSVRSSIPKSKRACFPVAVPPWQVLKEVETEAMSTKPSTLAGSFLIEELRKKYPCQ
jgi:hypothetical protein